MIVQQQNYKELKQKVEVRELDSLYVCKMSDSAVSKEHVKNIPINASFD